MWRRHDAQDHHHRGRPGVAGGTSRRAVANVPERARPDTGTNSTSGNVTTFRDRSGRMTGTAERMRDLKASLLKIVKILLN